MKNKFDNSESGSILGSVIQKVRKAKKITQEELGKRVTAIFLLLSLPLSVLADEKIHVKVNLKEAGSLQDELMDTDYDRIDSLTISGKFSGVDLAYLKKGSGRLASLEFIDLTDIEIVECDEPYYSCTDIDSSIGGYGNPPVHFYYLSNTEYTTSEQTGALASQQTKFYHHTPNLEYGFCGSKNSWGQVAENFTLKEIRMPKASRQVGEYMCMNCQALERAVLPEGCKQVGDRAFMWCKSLTDIVNTEKIDSIGASAFYYAQIDAQFAPLKYIGKGYEGAFDNNTRLKAITFADGIPFIPQRAFANCYSLEELAIPGSVETIGESAFEGCSGLKKVSIGEGTKILEAYAFRNCSQASDFTMPSTIVAIGQKAFDYVPFPFEVEDGVSYIRNIAYSVSEETTNIVIREGTTVIVDYFRNDRSNSSVTSVSLPSTLKSIGSYAFESARSLSSITLPEGLEYIGEHAFDGAKLSSITIPSTVASIGEGAFSCENMVRVNWNAVDAIAEGPLSSSIEKVTFGEGVKRVPDELMRDCSGLVRAIFSSTIEEIGTGAFSGCESLKRIDWAENGALKKIGGYAFGRCKSLNEFVLPKEVEVIDNSAFLGCDALERVILSEGSQLREIGQSCFADLNLLTSINLETSSAPYMIIGEGAFSNTSLTSVSLHNVKIIGENAFRACKKLEVVNIPINSPLEEIGDYSFYYCPSLSSFTFPDGIKKIGKSVLYDTSVSTIVLPERLEFVGGSLAENDIVKDVYVLFRNPEIAPNGVHWNNHNKATLHVPYGTKDAFWSMRVYSDHFNDCVEFGAPSYTETIDEPSNINLSSLANVKDLSSAVVDGVYYAMDSQKGDGYDKAENCLVLNSTMNEAQMDEIQTANGNDISVVTHYNGIIMQVATGSRTLVLEGQTIGSNKLMVKFGNEKAIEINLPTRGTMAIPYQADEDTRVYIYAATAKTAESRTGYRTSAAANTVKLYDIKIKTDDSDGINILPINIASKVIYNLQGQRATTVKKGLYIIQGKKVLVSNMPPRF
jgi:hypothetical protein